MSLIFFHLIIVFHAFSFDNKDRWHQVRARLEHAALRQPPRALLTRRTTRVQIDNLGVPNSVKLGEFLHDPDTRYVLNDKAAIKTVTFKESLAGPNISMEKAIANSEAWVFDEPNLDDFPPAAADDFFAPSTPPSAVGSSCETTPASEKSSGKRARRA